MSVQGCVGSTRSFSRSRWAEVGNIDGNDVAYRVFCEASPGVAADGGTRARESAPSSSPNKVPCQCSSLASFTPPELRTIAEINFS